MSRCVQLNAFSEDMTSQLGIVERPIPAPKPEEVLVRVTCRPINPADVFSLMGQYPGFQPKLPATPGLEGCGVVHDNNGHSLVRKGQRVIVLFDAAGGNGSWQEYVCVRPESLIPVPDNVPDEVACQFLVNPVTILGMIHELNPPPGSYIIQTAAASTLGKMFIAVAKQKGIKTINVIRRDEQIPLLKEIGADIVINAADMQDGELRDRIRAEVGDGVVWGAVDPVGGSWTKEIMQCVREGGHVLIYAPLSGPTCECTIYDILFRQVTIRGFWLMHFLQEVDDTTRNRIFYEVMDLMKEGVMTPTVWQSFPLDQVAEAVKCSWQPGKPGKVLLRS